MAKIQIPGGGTIATTNGALQLSSQPSGTNSMQLHPNNYSTTSAIFHAMNNGVIFLDATYDQLSLSEKAIWEARSLNYIGVPVCGCPREIISGKKLFRLQNWIPYVTNGPLIMLPPAFIGGPAWTITQLLAVTAPPPPDLSLAATRTDATNDAFFILQIGDGLGNPIGGFAAGSLIGECKLTPAQWADLTSMTSGILIKYCGWENAYEPTGTGSSPLLVIP